MKKKHIPAVHHIHYAGEQRFPSLSFHFSFVFHPPEHQLRNEKRHNVKVR